MLSSEFQRWKDEYEGGSDTLFVKSTGEKGQGSTTTTTYYYCNRSGIFYSKGTGQRHVKSQGSSKLNAHCTAAITVRRNIHSTILHIFVCKSHYGHTCSLGHIRLSEADRLSIAGQLSQGVTFERILDNIRDNVGSKFERIHLTTRKDISNIERSYGLRGIERHKDDATSVSVWVQEMNKRADKPVLLYKPQGQPQPPQCTNLTLCDFVLAIQTPLQAEMMKSFGTDKIVCIDSTHGTNGYDFFLISIVVVDEYGEGYPVAWCLSNRQDEPLLNNFFVAVRERVGKCVPKILMSDDAEQFYTAWTVVFGPGPKKLLCTWHVDRAWRTNLSLIQSKDTAALVYKYLRILLEETDMQRFENLLDQTLIQITQSPETSSFGDYFITYYSRRADQWAACYCKAAFINCNMYVEAFHHVLKYIYLKGTVNKRVDKCIHVLMKLARDKGFERLVKLEKGKHLGG